MKIIVTGCGRTGSGLVRALEADGHDVAVVDHDEGAFARLGSAVRAARIVGIAFDREVLEHAGIATADAVAAVTGNDEVNAVVARLAARMFRVPRVVARLYDPGKAQIYRRLGVQVVAPVDWGIHRAAELLTFSEVGELISLGSGQVDVVEVELPYLLAGRTIDELMAPGEVHPVAVSRSGRTFLPTAGTVLEEGDIVHLAVVAASRSRLQSLLGTR